MEKKQKELNSFGGDTIAAIATASGGGAIAIIKISGENAKKIGMDLLNKSEAKAVPQKIFFSKLETESVSDEVMAVYFKSPHSYTGEDVFEIQCHGGEFLAKRILEECIKCGARPAENGEFSRRAYLNGKIDLTKAEGIVNIINARSVSELNAAYAYIEGGLRNKIEELQNGIKELTAKAGVAIDFPEEDE
jgi:tRNA modification GTPase